MNFLGSLRNAAGHKKKICGGSDSTARGKQMRCSILHYRSIYDCNRGRFQLHLRITVALYSGSEQSGYRYTKLTSWLRSLTCCVSWSISKNLAVLFSPAQPNFCKLRGSTSVRQQAYIRHGIPYNCTWKTVATVLCFPAFYENHAKITGTSVPTWEKVGSTVTVTTDLCFPRFTKAIQSI